MKNLSLFLVFLGLSLFGISQTIPQDVINLVNNCQYIFEGTVIRSDSYWGSPDSAIYTSHTLQIHKILKGNLMCGTVEVITRGGRVGDEGQIISHNLVLYEGLKGAFFCSPTNYDLSAIDFYPETNADPLQVEFGEQGYLRYYYDGINKEVSNNRISLDSIAAVYDAVELLTQLNYIDCEATIAASNGNISVLKAISTPPKSSAYDNTILNQKQLEKVNQRLQIANNQGRSNKIAATNELIYTFENMQITQTFPRYFEFDVSMSASDNDSYIDIGFALVQYPKLLFGADIVGNNKITITRSTVLASVGDYDMPVPVYENDSTFQVLISATQPNPTRYNLTTIPTPAFHVKIEYQNCSRLGNLFWGDVSVMNAFSVYTTSATGVSSTYYNTTSTSSFVNIPRCLPVITDFNPKNVKAGVGDIVTISGKFFGQTRGTGGVWFRDADKLSVNGYVFLDSVDYIPLAWSDNQIQVKVPSFNINLNNSQGANHSAGSGKIKIKNGSGDTTSSYSLIIPNIIVEYSIISINDASIGGKKRIDLVDTWGPGTLGNGGYAFYIAPNIYNNPDAYRAVKKALREWQCLTNVPFTIKDSLPAGWNKMIAVKDQINVIQFGTIVDLGETAQFPNNCANSNGNPFSGEIDIILSNGVFWNYDTTGGIGIATLETDFYHVILHELGHAHLLEHVADKTDIMYLAPPSTPTAAAARVINLGLNNKNGGNNVLNHSQNTPHGTCLQVANVVLLNPCAANSVENEYENNTLKVYPNPFDDIIQIELSKSYTEPLTIEVYNLQGQRMLKQSLANIDLRTSLNLSNIVSGVYILEVSTNKQQYIVKVIKQ